MAKQKNIRSKTIDVEVPVWAINTLDQEAARVGVPRQALIKGWLVERVDQINKQSKAALFDSPAIDVSEDGEFEPRYLVTKKPIAKKQPSKRN